MASVKTVFRKDKVNKNGNAPIHFRIIKNRRISYISSGIMIPVNHWDEKNKRIKGIHPHSGRLNSLLSNRFAELQDHVLELETTSRLQTSRQIRDRIFGMKPVDFFEFAQKAIIQYKLEGKIGTHDRTLTIINKIKKYSKASNLSFHDITLEFLSKYEKYLRKELLNKTNTIHANLKFIRKLFNDAIREDIIEYKVSPFRKYKLRTEKTQRTYLTEQELQLIENFSCPPHSKIALHRDMFIFAAYTGGLRISDVLCLKWINFDGTHIHITIKKTGAQLSIKVPNKGLSIIDKYKPEKPKKNGFIFPIFPENFNLDDEMALDLGISRGTAYINKHLKIISKKIELGKNISFHTSRHAFAVMALRKGISIDKVSKLMAHAAIRETQIYAKVVNEDLDKAMDTFNI